MRTQRMLPILRRSQKIGPSLKKGKKTKLFIISAPSGCGKTTLCNRLLADDLGLVNSVSMTTRPRRRREKEGIDYYFVSKRYFKEMIGRRGFLEYEDNFGHLYGTPKKFVEGNLKSGRPVLLSIDVKGAMKVKKAYPGKSVLIFILPPSMDALKRRLRSRKSDGIHAMSKRLGLAKQEMGYRFKYDYRIVNDRLENAYRRLRKAVAAELEK